LHILQIRPARSTVSIIDTETNAVTATVHVGSYPSGVAVTPDGTKIYVGDFSYYGTVSVINTATNTVSAIVSVGQEPYGVAVTPDGTKVYVANYNWGSVGNVSVIDTATNTVTATGPVGYEPWGVAVTPDGSKVYVTNSGNSNAPGNTVSVIDTATNSVTATVNVGINPAGVAVTPDGTKVYVTNLGNFSVPGNTVSVIDTAANTVIATINVGQEPYGVVVTPNGQNVYVANNGNNNVSVINTATNTVSAIVSVGIWPDEVAVTPDGTKVYVTNIGSNNVSVIDTATNTITATVNVGNSPVAFGQFISSPVIPTADFSGSPTTGNGPTTVKFTDKSTGLPTLREWLFGDGGYTTSQIPINPVHTYENAGNYNVSLKVKNDWGINKVEKSKYINITAFPPDAHFRINPTQGLVPLTVQFTDKTTGVPTSWYWDFGDGTDSTLQNPVHSYNTAGIYTPILAASNNYGTSTKTSTVPITVT
jgi:YVTN family beta-propeller protein